MSEHRTDAERAEILYSGRDALLSSWGPALADNFNQLADRLGVSMRDRENRLWEFTQMFRDADLPQDRAARMLGVLAHHTANPASDEQVRTWTARSRQLLREKFGADADHRLDTAREFIKARPWLGTLLYESGVGGHEEFVVALAENAHKLRITPKKEGA